MELAATTCNELGPSGQSWKKMKLGKTSVTESDSSCSGSFEKQFVLDNFAQREKNRARALQRVVNINFPFSIR